MARKVTISTAQYADMESEEIIVAPNDSGYAEPLSAEWEDGRMDLCHGAKESCAFVRRIDFTPSDLAFDADFSE